MVRKNRTLYILILVCFLSGIINSCKNKSAPDISEIITELKINRLEKDLFSASSDNLDSHISFLKKKYGQFFDLYNHRIITIGGSEKKEYPDNLNQFLNDDVIKQIYNESIEIFPELENIREDLDLAFSYYKFYFPEKSMPEVYTYISGFNQSVVTDEKILGIGLDKYLGEDCDFYVRLGLPEYITKNMHPGKIIPDCMTAWANMEFDQSRPDFYKEDISNNLINNILFSGKIMYFLDAVLPDEQDSIKIGYSGNQIEWCKSHEIAMWDYLIENKLLFSTNAMVVKKMLNNSPFTQYFNNESPGRTGVWIGWQIIKSYMKNNKVELSELMTDKDYRNMLNNSGYNPG